jgi:serine O-acetyltransferase
MSVFPENLPGALSARRNGAVHLTERERARERAATPGCPLPTRPEIERFVNVWLDVLLLDEAHGCSHDELSRHERELAQMLDDLVARCVETKHPDSVKALDRAKTVRRSLLELLPTLRERVRLDVSAAYEGDPACDGLLEAALCYPGVHALAAHRAAHELHRRDVPLLPRLMNELIHSRTGIDIHPGARIGKSFFMDHGTGIVIGSTTVIGDHCKLYQGVTLGASSVQRRDGDVGERRDKRHPTLEDHVTVYAGATILGGDTTIGAGSVIGGGVFLTESVPPRRVVTNPKPVVESRKMKRELPVGYEI